MEKIVYLKKKRHLLEKIVGLGLLIIAIWYISKNIYIQWDKIVSIQWSINLRYFLLANLLLIINYILFLKLWAKVLHLLGKKTGIFKLAKAYFYSLLLKYIPGKIWLFLGRLYRVMKEGVSIKIGGASILIELTLQFLSAVLLTLLSFSIWWRLSLHSNFYFYYIVYLGLFTLVVITIYPNIFIKMTNFIFRLVSKEKKDQITYKFTRIELLSLLGRYSVIGIIDGVILYFIINTIFKVPIRYIIFVIGMNAVIKTISFFLPSQLGVVEVFQITFLKIILPSPFFIIIPIFNRIWKICVEVISFLAVSLMEIKCK